jgi:putative holliday junction resolvase
MNDVEGKILGVDYGTKRVGLAISDESLTFARELKILPPNVFWKEILEIINENKILKIILGWPLNMNGGETNKTREVKKFIEKLKKITNIEIDTIDERMSSKMAHNLPGGNVNVDSLAAQIFLQSYLDKIKNQ